MLHRLYHILESWPKKAEHVSMARKRWQVKEERRLQVHSTRRTTGGSDKIDDSG